MREQSNSSDYTLVEIVVDSSFLIMKKIGCNWLMLRVQSCRIN